MNGLGTASPFLFAWLLDRKGGGRLIDDPEAINAADRSGIVWVHLNILEEAALSWLHEDSGLEPVIVAQLCAGETRPRVVANEHGMLLLLRGINMNPGAQPDDMVTVRIWLEHNRIVTTVRRSLLAISDVYEAIGQGDGPRTSGEFLIMLAERLAERIGDAVDNIESNLDGLEEALASDLTKATLAGFSALRRQAAAIRRYLAPQRDALERLYREHGPVLTGEENRLLREEADRMTRALEDIDLVRERATVLQEEYMSRLAHEQNARIYVLSVVAVIFLPLSFLTGLLGMNVAGLPGTENPAGFTISAAVMISVGIALVVFFRWKKWI